MQKKKTRVNKQHFIKNKLHRRRKITIKKTFDSLNKDKLWVLKATFKEAAKRDEQPESVEEKMMKFALQCNFHHPSHSWILDTKDDYWNDVFLPAELKEIHDTGWSLFPPTKKLFQDQLNELAKLEITKETYKFAQQIKHDPSDDLLMIMFLTSSLLFVQSANVDGFMETDKQYRMFGFVNTIYVGSDIAVSGERCVVTNKKHQLLAINEIQRKVAGRKMDAVYIGGRKELGCMEAGSNVDQTKELYTVLNSILEKLSFKDERRMFKYFA
ncbi:hypothetical protein INT45_007115 [Circinella minor]|uniref:Uncharacterized protein n=1 Tax=Circinella minor TaxID=1195481 RepID=A0A8H7SCS4_9FUNG|nr:hypothetical protein INT45_007115 [Circinella minor]